MTIAAGQKVALVGANGSGKTTLIRTIMGESDYSQGSIERSDRIHVGRLRQEATFNPDQLVIDILFADDTPRAQAIKQYEKIISHPDFDPQAFADIQHQIDTLDAWTYESRVRSIISQLQLTPFLEQTFGSLSGGEAKRIALAKVLIEDPQMLILDEPTNHLDVTMIEWLEDYIARYDLTILMVTHDRYFLDRVCTDIYELYDGQITTYPGSYQHYLYAKSQRDTAADDLLHETKMLYRKELQWMRTSPRARQTKSVDRQKKFYDLEKDYKTQRKTSKLRRQ
ncbi:MAG: ABC-F family ATP-binding cassette domain-containing protein [Candidatus Peribacteria bacterium]|nr:MAG: ABC-F family ATP-binding cassette domain-containing protein [Candidatus Peribacteria bacterium]